jgi:UDP-N-acetylmuramate: L-alanyl-gamma-D-glutamyl-meso-diaminopimelate ligase
LGGRAAVLRSVESIIDRLLGESLAGDHVLVMSNGGFGGIHQRLLDALAERDKT